MIHWSDQYERVKRWFVRIEEFENGAAEKPLDTAEFRDNYLTFFENCLHLRDHIQESHSSTLNRDVVKFVEQDPWLSLCADIANGQKHLAFGKLKSPKSGENPEPSQGTDVTLRLPEGKASASLSIKTDNGEIDAFHLANKCLESWEHFLISEGLL